MEAKKQNIFKTIKVFFQSLFKKENETKSAETKNETNEEKINSADTNKMSAFESLQINISEENGDENIIAKIPTHLMIVSAIYGKIGSIHAKSAARDYNIMSVASSEATLITEHIQSVVNGRVAGLQHQIDAQEQKKTLLKEELDICQEHRKQLLEYANDNENQFSLWRGIMYNFFGGLLLLADIPLSLSVVSSYGLVKTTEKNADFLTKISNTEAMLFAFGVAFCTILIKILYDEYINTRLGKWALELREFKIEERHLVNKERLIKLGVKLIILLGLLTMLYYSGIFREANLSGKAKEGRFISFMLLTIVIPTISGICLSIGLNNLSNIGSLKKSILNLEKNKQIFDVLSEEQRKLVIKSSQLMIFQKEWNNSTHKINTISEQFVSNYNQGYKNSYLTEYGYDLYKQIQDFHSETINKKFNKK